MRQVKDFKEHSKDIKFTYHDYEFLPDDKRYEILEGDLCMVPAPNEPHQRISRNLEYLLLQYLEKNPIGVLYDAPFDVVLSMENVVQPDIMIVLNERKGIITEKNIQGPPDILIEILSPKNHARDKKIKFKIYAKYGIREYWIVDPNAQSIEVYKASSRGFDLIKAYTPGILLESPLLPKLSIDMRKVFA